MEEEEAGSLIEAKKSAFPADIQQDLFQVPSECEFPLEVNLHLKEKLHVSVLRSCIPLSL